MAENPDSPLFAERYRFESVGADWDRGRSGLTLLVYDLKEKRLGVIKRAEAISRQAVEGLKNEAGALRALREFGVPELYATDQAVYASKKYFYTVIEYIDGMRIERKLDSLNVSERAEILTQFFGLLAQAHRRGIVNGDVDLKHLFWRKDKRQLILIDWGNAQLNADPKQKTDFAYDLARSAEIIFSLVTRQGYSPATGSIALPDNSALVPGLVPLPVEFRKLCKWAPRTPSDGAHAPYTAQELFEVSKRWFTAIRNSKPYRPNPPALKRPWLIGIPLLGLICFALLAIFKFFWLPTTFVSPTLTFIETSAQLPDVNTPVLTETAPTVTPAETLIPTVTPTLLPSPLEYPSPIVVFDDKPLVPEFKLCWTNEVDPPAELAKPEGFNRKVDNTWWVFNTWDGRTTEESIKADFGTCLNGQLVNAIALNTWVTQIQPESGNIPGAEFGLFLKATDSHIREYILWVDQSERLHLRIREDAQIVYDDTVLVVNFQHSGIYSQFLIQIFLEMDNNGSTIIYLSEAGAHSTEVQDINPNQMIRIDAALRPKLDNLQGFGLIGRGGPTQVLIWPLVFFGK